MVVDVGVEGDVVAAAARCIVLVSIFEVPVYVKTPML